MTAACFLYFLFFIHIDAQHLLNPNGQLQLRPLWTDKSVTNYEAHRESNNLYDSNDIFGLLNLNNTKTTFLRTSDNNPQLNINLKQLLGMKQKADDDEIIRKRIEQKLKSLGLIPESNNDKPVNRESQVLPHPESYFNSENAFLSPHSNNVSFKQLFDSDKPRENTNLLFTNALLEKLKALGIPLDTDNINEHVNKLDNNSSSVKFDSFIENSNIGPSDTTARKVDIVKEKIINLVHETKKDLDSKLKILGKVHKTYKKNKYYKIGYIVSYINKTQEGVSDLYRYVNANKDYWDVLKVLNAYVQIKKTKEFLIEMLSVLSFLLSYKKPAYEEVQKQQRVGIAWSYYDDND